MLRLCISLLVSITTDGTFLCDQTLGDCENLREFLGSSKVAYPKNDESYCDSLLLNFSDTVSCCQYYDETPQFEYGPKNNPPFSDYTSILDHSKKILNFYETVCNFSRKPDIICVSETRVQTTPLINIGIPGYEFVFTSPLKKKSGGVGICVTTNLHFRIKQNWLEYEDCEDLWINVSDQNSNCNCNVIAL